MQCCKQRIYFLFRVGPAAKLIESAPYGGFRFPIRSMIAGRLFVAFSLDIGLGDAITPPIEEMEGVDWLDFCGVAPAKFEAISLEQQFAEKIHAMTVDRGERENSRVKDLVDVLLLIEIGLNRERVVECLANTFRRCGKTPVPSHLRNLSDSWRQPFSQLATGCDLNPDFGTALDTLSAYWSELKL